MAFQEWEFPWSEGDHKTARFQPGFFWTGIGFGPWSGFNRTKGWTHPVYEIDLHNSHLTVLLRLGFPGLALYLSFFGLILLRGLRQRDPPSRVFLASLVAGLVLASFSVALEGPFLGVPIWFLAGLGLSAEPLP